MTAKVMCSTCNRTLWQQFESRLQVVSIKWACLNETIQGMFWVNEYKSLKIVTMGSTANNPLTHQQMSLLWKEIHGLLLELLHYCSLKCYLT